MPKKAATTASLYWHCKTEKGWKRFPVVIGGNGRISKGVVLINGKEKKYPQGTFHLRTHQGGFRNLGDDVALALDAQRKAESNLSSGTTPVKSVQQSADAKKGKTVQQLTQDWLEELNLHLMERSMLNYRAVIKTFNQTVKKMSASDIDASDYHRVVKAMRERRLSESTIFCRAVRLLKFFHYIGVPKEKMPDRKDKPKEFKPKPEAYSEEEIMILINGTKQLRNAVIYEFLWKTGAREQETVTLEWHDIDFRKNIIRLRNKFKQGHRIKTSEERDIPLTPMLADSLTFWHKKNPGRRYVFGQLRSDKPRRNVLRHLKRDAWALGLACKTCARCLKHKECERYWLHKFRATYATSYLQGGGDLRTLMKLMGHQDIESTMRYLDVASAPTTQAQVTAIFDKPAKPYLLKQA